MGPDVSDTRRVKRWYGWTIEPVGTPEPPKPKRKPQPVKWDGNPSGCTEHQCSRKYYARGWCRRHYYEKHGTPEWQARDNWIRPKHGTRTRYKKGCRCDECRRYVSEYVAEWRRRTGRTKQSYVLEGWPSAKGGKR